MRLPNSDLRGYLDKEHELGSGTLNVRPETPALLCINKRKLFALIVFHTVTPKAVVLSRVPFEHVEFRVSQITALICVPLGVTLLV